MNENQCNDYNLLVSDKFESKDNHIIEIDATNSSINHIGFPYLKNLKHLSMIKFNGNDLIDDHALQIISQYDNLRFVLKHLEIIKCCNVTDNGLLHLKDLRSLEYLRLVNLPSVDKKDQCKEILQRTLEKCKIEWP